MKVLKFGGTSVGTVESLREVKKIVESIEGNSVIVVSALGGLTDSLIRIAKASLEKDEFVAEELKKIEERHSYIINNLVENHLKSEISLNVKRLIEDLDKELLSITETGTLNDEQMDVIVSYGERLSSVIIAGIITHGKHHNSLNFIKTESWFGKNVADLKLTESLIKKEFSTIGQKEKAIVPGFISTDKTNGRITNLGRGGSDYTGALIAAALDAEVLEIWTDVDGFMTADPRIVKEARVIDNLSFSESMELCSFGAKVVYPPTIYPVFHKNIPIRILNTFNHTATGSLISDNQKEKSDGVKGITILKEVALCSIKADNPEVLSKSFSSSLNMLTKEGIVVIPISHPEVKDEGSFVVFSADVEKTLNILKKAPISYDGFVYDAGNPVFDIKNDLSALAVVGNEMKTQSRLAARIEHTLYRNNIRTEASSTENSDTTFIFIITKDKANEALSLVHSLIF